METVDFHPYSAEVLALLEQHVPAWKDAIDAERVRRMEQHRIWNSARLLAEQYHQWLDWRFLVGYSANEEARGFDDWESDQHHQLWKRIRTLRHRSLRCLNRRHKRRI